jgi:hypothetical protein
LNAAGTGTLVLSASGLNFGSVVLQGNDSSQTISVLNTGSVPVTVNAISATTTQGSAGDFSMQQSLQEYEYGGQCGLLYGASSISFPYEIAPQGSCTIVINFNPSITGQETGTVSVSSSATGSPLSASLSGVGLHSVQALTVQPGNLVFPPQPVGEPSAAQSLTITNGGEDFVVLDRAVATGDFEIDEVNTSTCEGTTLGPLTSCTLGIVFDPTAVGARSGTLTLTDTLSGKPQVFNLAGTAIRATGTPVLSASSLSFSGQPTGSTSPDQELTVSNPGNSPVTMNGVSVSGDFAQDQPYSEGCVGSLAPAATCSIYVAFSPTKSSGSESGMLTVHSTAGSLSAALSGSVIAAKQAIQITTNSISFGRVMVGANGSPASVSTAYIENTGNEPVTFLSPPTITAKVASDAADFTFNYCYPYLPAANETAPPLPVGQGCQLSLAFTPSRQGKKRQRSHLWIRPARRLWH